MIIISALTADATTITDKFGYGFGSALIVIASIKGMKISLSNLLCICLHNIILHISALRSAYSDISCQYLVLLFSDLFFHYDYANATESFLLNYFIISILYRKISDLLLKVNFEMIYYFLSML